MKKVQDGDETRTIERRLSHDSIFPILDKIQSLFARMRHLLYRALIIKKGQINELKKIYIAEYRITARQFNSLAKEATAREKALEELKSLSGS